MCPGTRFRWALKLDNTESDGDMGKACEIQGCLWQKPVGTGARVTAPCEADLDV